MPVAKLCSKFKDLLLDLRRYFSQSAIAVARKQAIDSLCFIGVLPTPESRSAYAEQFADICYS